jgi:multimeric flavodoxin WrbA
MGLDMLACQWIKSKPKGDRMKALLVNGSPRPSGCTFTALRIVADAIHEEGVETEIFQIPTAPLRGCASCGWCLREQKGRCAFDDDCVNRLIEKAETSDGFIFGAPVYFSSPAGQLVAVMDRAFFAGNPFRGKPAGAVCSARRAGNSLSLDILNKYFLISGMPVVTTTYWPMVHGVTPEDVFKDKEGVQTMKMLGRNMVWTIKSLEAAKAAGVQKPPISEGKKIWTNFIEDGTKDWVDFIEGR